MTTHELAIGAGAGQLAQRSTYSPYQMLDTYAEGRIELPGHYLEPIAAISLGYRAQAADGRSYPRASRRGDQQLIHLHDPHDLAPVLRKRLEASLWRSLTISFPSDDPREFIHEGFAIHASGRLVAYGDEHGMTEIVNTYDQRDPKKVVHSEHRFAEPGTPRFKELVRASKVQRTVHFMLARWEGARPRLEISPEQDGARDPFGCYRIRMTSRNSMRSLLASIDWIAGLTGGRLCGVPFELSVVFRQAYDPSGAQREIPTWRLDFKPPIGLALDVAAYRQVMRAALAQGTALALPPPQPQTLERAIAEADSFVDEDEAGPDDLLDPTPDELRVLEEGGPADVQAATRWFFTNIRGSWLEQDEAWRDWLVEYTSGEHRSLARFLRSCSQRDVEAFQAAVVAELSPKLRAMTPEEQAQAAAEYTAIFGPPDDGGNPPPLHPPSARPATEPSDPSQTHTAGQETALDSESVPTHQDEDSEPATARYDAAAEEGEYREVDEGPWAEFDEPAVPADGPQLVHPTDEQNLIYAGFVAAIGKVRQTKAALELVEQIEGQYGLLHDDQVHDLKERVGALRARIEQAKARRGR